MRKLCLLALALSAFILCRANVRLPNVLSSNMVLQQRSKAALWGWCEPGERIAVTTSWDGKTDSIRGTRDGNWRLSVATPAAGGPYTITIKGQNTLVLDNILFFHVPRTTAIHPQDDCPGNWTVCDSTQLKTFSAVAYFFGKKLNKELN